MKKYGASPSYFTRNDMRWLHLERKAGGSAGVRGGDPQPSFHRAEGVVVKKIKPQLRIVPLFLIEAGAGEQPVLYRPRARAQRTAKKSSSNPKPKELGLPPTPGPRLLEPHTRGGDCTQAETVGAVAGRVARKLAGGPGGISAQGR